MSPALTILLITFASGPTDTGSLDDPFTPAIARAAREALGPEVRVTSRRLDTEPSDEEAAALGDEAHADAVVEVRWSTRDHLRATIHMERRSTGRWLDREIGFRELDEPAERSRTVGFAIASMLPERTGSDDRSGVEVPNSADEPESASSGGSEPPVRAAETPRRAVVTAAGPRASASGRDEHDARTPSRETPVRHVRAISAVAVAALGAGDHAGSVGGALDYRNTLIGPLSVRVGVSAKVAFDLPAGIAARFFGGSAGLAWRGWASRDGRTALGLRFDTLVALEQIERRSGGTTATKNKVMPGADVLGEASYFFTREVAIVIAAGGEALFGQTEVVVDGHPVTTFEPFHALGELGLRVGF